MAEAWIIWSKVSAEGKWPETPWHPLFDNRAEKQAIDEARLCNARAKLTGVNVRYLALARGQDPDLFAASFE